MGHKTAIKPTDGQPAKSGGRKRSPDFLDQAAAYLVANDWKPIVIGGIEIHSRPGTYNYSLVIHFAGVKAKP